MSGNQAPGRTLVSLAGVDPFVDNEKRLTTGARQFLIRLIGLVGQSSGSGATITQQLADLTAALAAAEASVAALTVSLVALEALVATLQSEIDGLQTAAIVPLLPIPPGAVALPMLRPLVPWLQ